MKTALEDIKRKIEDYKNEIAKLESELKKYDEFIPMVAIIKGKITLQIHPKKQMQNLSKNGWRVADSKDIEEFKNYIK